jgi:hypothetical protein
MRMCKIANRIANKKCLCTHTHTHTHTRMHARNHTHTHVLSEVILNFCMGHCLITVNKLFNTYFDLNEKNAFICDVYSSKIMLLYNPILFAICTSTTGLESREYGRRDPSRWPRSTFYPQKLTLTSRTSGSRSVGIVRSRTQATEFSVPVHSANRSETYTTACRRVLSSAPL